MDGFSSYSSLYDTSSLLQFCNDDSASAASSLEVSERISSLEQRVQMQEDEIQLLKSALADVVRRLNLSEEQEQSSRRGATKARPMMATLPQRASVNNGSVLPKKKLPSPPRNTPGNKSSVRRTNSHEHVGLSRKDSSESKGSRARAGSTGSNRSDSRNKDPVFNADEGSVRMFFKGRPVTLFLPKDLLDDYSLEARAELPSHRLKLSWVYGYRGRDCRSNLHLLPTGETLYFLDAVVVLFNVDEQLQRHYTGHTSDIKCLAVHPDKITIATGQGGGTSGEGRVSPQVRVWDSVSLNTLHVLGSGVFERGLACVSFSKSNGGNSLCAVDDSHDHVLSVWDWQREERLAEVKSSSESVFAADFHPTDSNLVVTCGKSHLNFWSLEKHTLVKKQGLFEKQDKPRFVLCLTFAENGDTITGDSSGNILVWSKGSQRISRVISGAHDGSIFSLTRLRNGTLVSGGKDRRLVSWDLNYTHIQSTEVPESFGPIRTIAEGRGEKLLIGTTKNFVLQGTLDGDFAAITQGHTDELWGLAVHPCRPHFLTCGSDRQVCLWDSTHHHVIWTKVLEDSAQSAAFHPNGSVVAIGTTSGRWLVLDSESKDLVTVHTDGNEQLSVMSFCPDGNFLAIGSHDNYIYIYAVSDHSRKYSRVGKCVGHSSCVTHLDWSCDSQYLMSNSGDEILYWIPSVCKQLLSVETSRDVDWSSNTCTLGFHVLGTWPDGGDGADIRASSRSRDQTLLVTGDDSGQIRLFSYPCCQARAPSHLYAAHSSHVTNISFLCNDALVVSTGDASVMQWSVL